MIDREEMKRVLVIGGGYGGLRAVEKLAVHDDIEVLLIDKNPYHYLQTEVYGYIAGQLDIHAITIDLAHWCEGFGKNISFLQDEILHIDFEVQEVMRKHSLESVGYDYLIIATGAQTHFFSFINGLEAYSHGVKTLERAYEFRKMFENLIYEKLQNTSTINSDKVHIIIGGAGLSGVEVAAEMAYVISTYSKTIGERTKEIEISLIDASETILPGMSTYVVGQTHKRLLELGVNIITNAFIEKVDDTNIYLRDGTKLPYCFMIFTGGIIASTIDTSNASNINVIGPYRVNTYLNIENHINVFAIGDCVEIIDKNGELQAPTAQLAEKSAEYVAEAIIEQIKGREIEPFDAYSEGVFVALGGHYAVGEIFKYIRVKGYSAYLLKKLITYSYYLGLKFRINTGYKNRIKEA